MLHEIFDTERKFEEIYLDTEIEELNVARDNCKTLAEEIEIDNKINKLCEGYPVCEGEIYIEASEMRSME